MSTVDLTEAAFEKTISENSIVLVDFWAQWCGPCRQFAPVFEAASEKHSDIVFAKVNTDAEQRLSQMAGIQSIPTLMAFRDRVLVFQEAGALPGHALDALIEQIKGLDMDEIRAKMAALDSAS